LPFGNEFSQAIRVRDSWRTCGFAEKVSALNGFLSVIIPETDVVIPSGVTALMIDVGRASPGFSLTKVPKTTHKLSAEMSTNAFLCTQITDLIETLMKLSGILT
jgi:hypothetical protein